VHAGGEQNQYRPLFKAKLIDSVEKAAADLIDGETV
jgi:hypothetical protein